MKHPPHPFYGWFVTCPFVHTEYGKSLSSKQLQMNGGTTTNSRIDDGRTVSSCSWLLPAELFMNPLNGHLHSVRSTEVVAHLLRWLRGCCDDCTTFIIVNKHYPPQLSCAVIHTVNDYGSIIRSQSRLLKTHQAQSQMRASGGFPTNYLAARQRLRSN